MNCSNTKAKVNEVMAVAKHIPGNTHKGMCFKDLPSLLNLMSFSCKTATRYLPSRLTLEQGSNNNKPKNRTLELCRAYDHPQASLSFPKTPKLLAMGTSNKDLDHRSGTATLRHDAHLTQAAPILRKNFVHYLQ